MWSRFLLLICSSVLQASVAGPNDIPYVGVGTALSVESCLISPNGQFTFGLLQTTDGVQLGVGSETSMTILWTQGAETSHPQVYADTVYMSLEEHALVILPDSPLSPSYQAYEWASGPAVETMAIGDDGKVYLYDLSGTAAYIIDVLGVTPVDVSTFPTSAPATLSPADVPFPSDCACEAPNSSLSGALCYPECPAGTRGVGPLCWSDCPEGFTDLGALCVKPAPYGRGTGYAAQCWPTRSEFGCDNVDGSNQVARCEADNGVGNCEWGLGIIYPTCAAGFVPFGCCICTPACPAGFTDLGAFCAKPDPPGRGVGVPLPCVSEFLGAMMQCVVDSFNSIKDSIDSGSLITSLTTFTDSLSQDVCTTIEAAVDLFAPMAMFTTALTSCMTGFTTYMGLSGEASLIRKASVMAGIVQGGDGTSACFFTGCGGVGFSAGVSAGIVFGVILSPDKYKMEGFSVSRDVDIDLGDGFGFTGAIDNTLTASYEMSISAGAGINLGSLNVCGTYVGCFVRGCL